jgi:hypothetical protein
MVLNWSKATQKQLLTITHFEDCANHLKYGAAAELQKR